MGFNSAFKGLNTA